MSKKHLELVRSLDCVVCQVMGIKQSSPTAAHHIESVRDEDSDYAAIAACWEHHQGPNGIHGLSRSGFVMRYKLTDIDLLALTIKQIVRNGC